MKEKKPGSRSRGSWAWEMQNAPVGRLAAIYRFQVDVCHEDKGTENLIATLRELQL